MNSIEKWENTMLARQSQSARAKRKSALEHADFSQGFVSTYKADPSRTGDPLLDALRNRLTPTTKLLDVGGGAGRFALALALHCRSVLVIEPSNTMIEVLLKQAKESDITNIDTINGAWEEVDVNPLHTVLCANVLHEVVDIESFVRKLEATATDEVLLVEEFPMSELSPFWKVVHGEDRIPLPDSLDLLQILTEMEIKPTVQVFDSVNLNIANDLQAAIGLLRQLLFVGPSTPEDFRLEQAAKRFLKETPNGLEVRSSQRRRRAIISWRAQ